MGGTRAPTISGLMLPPTVWCADGNLTMGSTYTTTGTIQPLSRLISWSISHASKDPGSGRIPVANTHTPTPSTLQFDCQQASLNIPAFTNSRGAIFVKEMFSRRLFYKIYSLKKK